MEPLRPGDLSRIGKYVLVGRLGAGSMGEVFLGRSPDGRSVAIKVVRPEFARDAEFRERFAREVAAARKVSGRFTAPVVDACLDEAMLWLATAYVAGPTLAQAVKDHGPLPLPAVRTLAACLTEGLKEIHAQGIVHRDLTPRNVMLATDGPRIIDFGIALALESTTLTHTSSTLNTPSYMSPEQATGRAIEQASDIFSLGAVLAFAATGKPPFGEGRAHALLFRVVSEPPDLVGVPAEIRTLIERCLAKSPAERPSAADLLAEFGTASLTANWLDPALFRDSTQPGPPASQPDAGRPGRPDAASKFQLTASTMPAHNPTRSERARAEARMLAERRKRNPTVSQALDPREAQPREPIGLEFSGGLFAHLADSARPELNAYSLYDDLERITTAPLLAKRLRRLAAETLGADPATVPASAWPTDTRQADIDAIRAGHLIPSGKALDAFVVSCGVRPEHLGPWHDAARRASKATVGIINLRTSAIELARAVDEELKALKRRRSSNALTRIRVKREDQRHDPNELNRATKYGHLFGLMEHLADQLGDPNRPYSRNRILPAAPYSLIEALRDYDEFEQPYWLEPAAQGTKDTVAALAAVQVDASGVDLTSLSLRERDAIIGVVWTDYTRWPQGHAEAIGARSIRIGHGARKVAS